MVGTPSLLREPVETLKGIGPLKAELLKAELGIFTIGDLLFHYPYRYFDRTKIYKIAELTDTMQFVQVRGRIESFEHVGEGRGSRLVAQFKDATGAMELVWFQGAKWVEKQLRVGKEYIAFGRPAAFRNKFSMPHPEMELVDDPNRLSAKGKFQPLYPSTEKLKSKGLDTKGIAKAIQGLLLQVRPQDMPEILPNALVAKYKFPTRYHAIRFIHQPEGDFELELSRQRVKYEELFFLQLEILSSKVGRDEKHNGYVIERLGDFFNNFYNTHLPFPLTGAQKRVLKEIRTDLLTGKQMNRLLQGDVGSGKTLVALITCLMAIDNGFQTAIMAPTEILARQHFTSILQLVQPLGLNVRVLTGSTKTPERKEILKNVEEGRLQLLLGTHALIEDTVKFQKLGLVVIDEQHRFGVAQRAKLWAKNPEHPPHILVMTATPIPRTLAMTLYGDLDVSVIDEMPPGRKPISTVFRSESARMQTYNFMKQQIELGRQIYVVYPLIEESETLDYKNLMAGYESVIANFPPPKYQVSIVHGQQKWEDREYEMQRFVRGETNIMVATTVIEVGINVPNASVMVIESAERFGLSQLHQLRGRVGRGADQSYCILLAGFKLSNEARMRLQTMEDTNDGFEISEVDLKLRGPGDLMGTQQSGMLDLHMADLAKDQKILAAARNDAMEILTDDPHLQKPEHDLTRRYIEHKHRKKGTEWKRIS
ncbi:MAG TPA: ATP-dependent DNA helicase RecG [Chitinophagales bacterium]|nr:ATP-dependent DNA helicase RecG [Chitinophagales bacterium]